MIKRSYTKVTPKKSVGVKRKMAAPKPMTTAPRKAKKWTAKSTKRKTGFR